MVDCQNCERVGRNSIARYRDVLDGCPKNRRGTCIACQKFLDFESKIDDARRTLERLIDERDKLATVLNEHHDPFASSLPVEIVSDIFLHCRPDAPSPTPFCENRYEDKDLIKAVFGPGRICQNWRKISHNTPGLWTIICTTITESNCLNSADIIQDWLCRSGELSLFVQVYMNELPTDRIFYLLSRTVIASVILHAHRWEVFDLRVPSSYLPWMSRALATKNLDRLQHLKYEFWDNENDTLQLKSSPCRITQRFGSLSEISVGVDHLTHFSTYCFQHDQDLQLFQNAPNLTSCFIYTMDGPTLMSGPPAISNSLRHLDIRRFPPQFWNSVTFPSLEVLRITDPSFDPSPWTSLRVFLGRSGSKIKELEIDDYDGFSENVVEVVKLTPDLERLLVTGCLSNAFLSSMEAAATSRETMQPFPDFLSKLKFWSITTYDPRFDWSWIVLLLTSLKRKSLRNVKLNYGFRLEVGEEDSTMNKTIFKHFMEAAQGLELHVKFGGEEVIERLCLYHKL